MDIMNAALPVLIINLILKISLGGLGIYTMILLIKALKRYIKKNS